MLKSYKYKLFVTKKQQTILNTTLEECRWLYNHFLEQRKTSWEQSKKSLNYHSQAVSIAKLKQERKSLKNVHSQVLQNVAVRIDLAFKSFFRRVKAGEKTGYPRFRGKGWYDSITYPQTGFKIKDGRLKLSKIGSIKFKYHRQLEGKVKTCTIRRSTTDKWYASFSCIVEAKPLPKSDKAIGIDVGLTSFITFSDGSKIANPRFFRQDEKDLAKVQRKLSKAEKGTPERKKRRKAVSKVHERISNRRNNFTHQEARKIVNKYGIICIEDLSTNQMVHNRCLSKSIHDAAWSQFTQYLSYKAENAGRQIAKVNPAYTSQTCNKCGHREVKKLSDRVHRCSCCGYVCDRDHNAALNILALGTQSISNQSIEAPSYL
ncbi:MAG: hypothetical protein DDT22_01128 [candidate division WS2 bacterium]|nr:hypothetical protein [Candidatus Lithacetigena glycinireducens]